MSASNQLAAFNYAVQPLGNLQIKNITAAYTVSPSDNNFILNCNPTASFTISMPPASSFPNGFNFTVWNTSTSQTRIITIDPNGSETIDKYSTISILTREGAQIVCDGTNWITSSVKRLQYYSENTMDAGIARPSATGGYAVAIGGGAISGSNYSYAIGANSGGNGSQTATGAGAMALGGSYASGTDSFSAGIANNTSSYGAKGANSIVLGQTAVASGSNAVAIGWSSSSSGSRSIALGYTTIASGNYAYALSAYGSALQPYSATIFGARASSNVQGKAAFGPAYLASLGTIQGGILVLTASTTDATPTVLTSDASTASTINQVILPDASAFAFTGTVVARRQSSGGTASAAWKIEGLIRRESGVGTTTLVASIVTPISNVPLWTLALTADTTNGGLTITFTGAAATNIQSVATVYTSESVYA
jgi:hypothetical protein